MNAHIHYADVEIAELITRITYNKKDRFDFFTTLDPAMRMAVFNDLSTAVQQDFLDRAPAVLLVQLLDHFDNQRAGYYLRRIKDGRRRVAIMKRLRQDLRMKVERFTSFHAKAAYEMVHFNYVLLPHTKTIADAADAVDAHRTETGKLPEVLVRKDGRFVGEIEAGTLIRERNDDHLHRHITKVTTIHHDASAAEIMRLALDTQAKKLVVLDADDESVIGVVYTKDILDLFDEKPEESLYNFAGLEENEHPFDSVMKKFSARSKWLIINLATTFLAAAVIVLFEDTLAAIAVLAIYIPVINGMGSNAGTQTFAVFIRGLALGEIKFENAFPAIRNEMIAITIQGLLHGSIVAVIATLLEHSLMVGIVAGLSVFFVLIVGVLAGAIIPLILQKLRKDPALSTGIILTTFTDVLGLLALFGLAAIFLL